MDLLQDRKLLTRTYYSRLMIGLAQTPTNQLTPVMQARAVMSLLSTLKSTLITVRLQALQQDRRQHTTSPHWHSLNAESRESATTWDSQVAHDAHFVPWCGPHCTPQHVVLSGTAAVWSAEGGEICVPAEATEAA